MEPNQHTPPPPPPPARPTIIQATLGHHTFCRHLQRKFSNELGFLPDEATRWYLDSGNVIIATENDDPAGMLISKSHSPLMPLVLPIFQAAICYDAQRRHIGLQLVDTLKRKAIAIEKPVIQLWCRADLEANAFWQAAGFTPVGARTGGRGRGVPHVCWRFGTISAESVWSVAASIRRGAGGIPRFAATAVERAELQNATAGTLRSVAEQLLRPAETAVIHAPTTTADLPRPTQLALF